MPEPSTQGDPLDDVPGNVRDGLAAVLEIYRDPGRALPLEVILPDPARVIAAEMVVAVP